MANERRVTAITRLIVFLGLAALAVFIYFKFLKNADWDAVTQDVKEVVHDADSLIHDENNKDIPVNRLYEFHPASQAEDVIEHGFFSLEYSEKDEQAKWVAYQISVDNLNKDRVDRTDDFRPDSKIGSGSALPTDYRGSGYDRGHLCPAADMAFSRDAMSTTFLMSNMSPQHRSFNRGVWKELEEQVRDWARAYDNLYVVTGPYLRKRENIKIGKNNKISVPKGYYKALLALGKGEHKAVAFYIPNARQTKPLDEFSMTIDSLESMTGLDFFPQLPDKQEAKLESEIMYNYWMYDADRYEMRLTDWNYD